MSHKIHFTEPGEGQQLTVVDANIVVKVPADVTDGTYELFELTGNAGSGAPLSRHPWAETYFVLDGEVVVTIGARTLDLTAGACVTIPPMSSHALEIVSPSGRMLVVSMTGSGSRFFAEMDAEVHLADGPDVFVPRILEVAARNEVTLLTPAPS